VRHVCSPARTAEVSLVTPTVVCALPGGLTGACCLFCLPLRQPVYPLIFRMAGVTRDMGEDHLAVALHRLPQLRNQVEIHPRLVARRHPDDVRTIGIQLDLTRLPERFQATDRS